MTYEEAVKSFQYKDGLLYWRSGKITGQGANSSNGYLSVGYNCKSYLTHRIVFLLHHGYVPEGEVDHIDRNKLNNSIENLREVSRVCNSRNIGNLSNNKSGVKGVGWDSRCRKWYASLCVNGKNNHLGRFDSFTEAVCHRLAAEQCLMWGECNDSSPAYVYLKSRGVLWY